MPCVSDYLAPTSRERELQRAAQLLAHVLERLGRPVDEALVKTAADLYARGPGGMTAVDYVPELCAVLTSLDEAVRDQIVYDARNKMSRNLADWWEEHLAADRAREMREAATTRERELRASALAKLTAEERAALKV